MGIFIATVEHEKAMHLFLQTFWGKKKKLWEALESPAKGLVKVKCL